MAWKQDAILHYDMSQRLHLVLQPPPERRWRRDCGHRIMCHIIVQQCCWVHHAVWEAGVCSVQFDIVGLQSWVQMRHQGNSLAGHVLAGDDRLLVNEQLAHALQQRKDCRGCKDDAGAPRCNLRSGACRSIERCCAPCMANATTQQLEAVGVQAQRLGRWHATSPPRSPESRQTPRRRRLCPGCLPSSTPLLMRGCRRPWHTASHDMAPGLTRGHCQ